MPDPFSLNLAPGVHGVRDGFVNWYLVEDDDGLTAVDAGLPTSWALFERLCGRIGRRTDSLRAVVLTHAHYDHVGFAEKARTELGVPVYVHRDDVELSRHPQRWDYERNPLLYLIHPAAMAIVGRMTASGALFAPPVKEVTPYGDGEVLPVPGRLRTVFTPGHTHGHTVLVLEDRGVVFAGDCVVMLDPYTGRKGPCLVARAATADSARNLRSLDALAATGMPLVLTGHGEPFAAGAEQAARLALEKGTA